MCFFDISSLFTCVPLIGPINVLMFYIMPNPEEIFIQFMKFAMMSVEFSLDDIIYS